jgi:cytochrome P450
MLVAGYETTARLLFWAAYLLALDRDEQTRLRSEIRAYPPDHVTKLDDLNNWPRLRQTLLETLRLYPPVAHIAREAIVDDVIVGEPVRAGTQVWISPWVIHRHRKFWDYPTAFMPDRFVGKPSPWTSGGAFLPFGAGPRHLHRSDFCHSRSPDHAGHVVVALQGHARGLAPATACRYGNDGS